MKRRGVVNLFNDVWVVYFVLLNYAVVFPIVFPYVSGLSCEFGYLKIGHCKVIFGQPHKAPCLK
jgi:hypothetical protein